MPNLVVSSEKREDKAWSTPSPSVSQLTPSTSSRKTVMTFQQLQASLSKSAKKRSRKKPIVGTPSSTYATPSPLAIRIRRDILQTEPAARKQQSYRGHLALSESKRDRLERKQRLLRGSPDPLSTPRIAAFSSSIKEPRFFTPSPGGSLASSAAKTPGDSSILRPVKDPAIFPAASPFKPVALNDSSAPPAKAALSQANEVKASGSLLSPIATDVSEKPDSSFLSNRLVVPTPSPFKQEGSVATATPSPDQQSLKNEVGQSIFSPPSAALKTSSISKKRQSPRNGQKLPVEAEAISPVPPPARRETKVKTSFTPPARTGGSCRPSEIGSRTPLRPLNTQSPAVAKPTPVDDDGPATRRNLDKRSARLRYSLQFNAEITKHEKAITTSPRSSARANSSVSVFVRKRPIFEHESERSDFDVIRADGPAVRVYKTQMGADMRKQTVQPFVFNCTSSFDEDADSALVYRETLQPLVELVHTGHPATLLMFGQTGSGKTFTMTACQELVAQDMLLSGRSATVQCVELAGKNCQDLLKKPTRAVEDIRLIDSHDGSVSFVNAMTVDVNCPHKLIQVLNQAQSRRATQSTAQNEVSSRSHAVYQIRLDSGGVLTLVDCAGTERRNDSLYHSRQRQAESVEINASLYALKECIRAKNSSGSTVYVPYRSNSLTRVLKESLERPDARLVVIATVAPNATDTEHSLETLKTVSNLTNAAWEEGEVSVVQPVSPTPGPVAPKKWTHRELVCFLKEKRLLPVSVVPEHLDGRAVMLMSKVQLRYALYDDADMADRLFRNLRAETDRLARLDLKRRMASAKASKM